MIKVMILGDHLPFKRLGRSLPSTLLPSSNEIFSQGSGPEHNPSGVRPC